MEMISLNFIVCTILKTGKHSIRKPLTKALALLGCFVLFFSFVEPLSSKAQAEKHVAKGITVKVPANNTVAAPLNTAAKAPTNSAVKAPSNIAKTTSSKASDRKRTVLAANKIHGRGSVGYAAARACPEILDKLFCYCGCDRTDGHNALLDCFTSEHGVYCDDCQEEAILANKLNKDGKSMKDIQEAVDKKFSRHYPFEKPSLRYQKYKDSRLYIKDAANGTLLKATEQSNKLQEHNKNGAISSDLKLKPGKSISKCCSGFNLNAEMKSKAK